MASGAKLYVESGTSTRPRSQTPATAKSTWLGRIHLFKNAIQIPHFFSSLNLSVPTSLISCSYSTFQRQDRGKCRVVYTLSTIRSIQVYLPLTAANTLLSVTSNRISILNRLGALSTSRYTSEVQLFFASDLQITRGLSKTHHLVFLDPSGPC